MAWGWDNYDNAMGGGLLGSLTEEEKRRLRMQSMGAMGAGLLDASGWSRTPITLGQGVGAGIANAQGAYQQGAANLSEYKDRQMQRDAAQAQAQSEAEGKAELERILAAGEAITPQTAMKIVMLAPSLSNVVQQAMKAQQPKEKVPLSSIGKRLADAGLQMGTPEWKQAYDEEIAYEKAMKARAAAGSGGAAKERDQYRTLTADEVKMAGFAPGTVGQINTATGAIKILSKPEAGKVGDGETGGMNPRQQFASGGLFGQAVNYVAARTGLSPDKVRKMKPEEVRQAVIDSERVFEGPILGRIPFTNTDLNPYVESAASKQAMVNNPVGIVTRDDREGAMKEVWNPTQPVEVQGELLSQIFAKQGQQAAPETQAAVAAPTSEEEYNALPTGAVYIDPEDGKKYRKP